MGGLAPESLLRRRRAVTRGLVAVIALGLFVGCVAWTIRPRTAWLVVSGISGDGATKYECETAEGWSVTASMPELADVAAPRRRVQPLLRGWLARLGIGPAPVPVILPFPWLRTGRTRLRDGREQHEFEEDTSDGAESRLLVARLRRIEALLDQISGDAPEGCLIGGTRFNLPQGSELFRVR